MVARANRIGDEWRSLAREWRCVAPAGALGPPLPAEALRPGAAFVADVARKRAAVPPAVATIVEARLRPVHRRLREATA